MSVNQDDDRDLAERPRPQAGAPTAPARPPAKQSYESNVDVQRWLREQTLDESAKPEFDPTLLTGRRDREWWRSSLNHCYEEDLISAVVHVAKSGKVATVDCCAASHATRLENRVTKC